MLFRSFRGIDVNRYPRRVLTEETVAMAVHEPHAHMHDAQHGVHERPEQSAKDPVCGMTVDPHTAQHRHTYNGRPYYFCSASCREKFAANPSQYLKSEPQAAPPVAPGTIYTCPMHPEIRQPGPGSCPICGMALEPEVASASAGPNPELVDMSRRFWIGLVLTVPVFALEMAGHLTDLHQWLSQQTSNWIQLVLATPVVLWAGWPFFERCVQSIRILSPNMWTLIGIGVAAAYGYSVVAVLAPGLFPPSFRSHGRVAVYFEAAAVIVSLTVLGQLLELRARS